MANQESRELKSVGYELFILLLSVLSVVNTLFLLGAVFFAGAGGPGQQVVLAVDAVMTPIFLGDFLYRLFTASSKRGYFFQGQGWADLLATVPMFRIFRAFRVVRVIRLFRTRGGTRFFADLVEARASATFYLTIFLVLLVIEAAGASIYYVESASPDANIGSASDALWWGLVTITTVGYGDQYPVTGAGRIIGVFLLFAGIGLFSVLTGFIANVFLAPPKPRPEIYPDGDPRRVIAGLRALIGEQEERAAAIHQRLDELERAVGPSR